MARFIGSLVSLGIARENPRGTYAAPTVWRPWVTFTFDQKTSQVMTQQAVGVIDEYYDGVFTTEKYGEGDFEAELDNDLIGYIFYIMMGTLNSAVVEAGAVWDHTFTLDDDSNQHPSLSFTIDEQNGDYAFTKVMLNTFELRLELNSFITYRCNFISRPAFSTIAPAVNHDDEGERFVCTHASVKFADDLEDVDAAEETSIQSLTLTVEKNLLRKHVLGTIIPYEILNQMFGVTGTITLPYENKTFQDHWDETDTQAMLIDIQDTSEIIGAASYPRIRIYLPTVFFTDWTPNRPKGELYDQTLAFTATREGPEAADSSTISSIIVRNETNTY